MPELELVPMFLQMPPLARRLNLIIMAFYNHIQLLHKIRIIQHLSSLAKIQREFSRKKITVVGNKNRKPGRLTPGFLFLLNLVEKTYFLFPFPLDFSLFFIACSGGPTFSGLPNRKVSPSSNCVCLAFLNSQPIPPCKPGCISILL